MHKQVYDSAEKYAGTFDGTYIYNLSGEMILRVDVNEIYSMDMPCKYVGFFDGGQGTNLDGTILFLLKD